MDSKFDAPARSGFDGLRREVASPCADEPVLVLFQINVWTGTETEMIDSEAGENRLIRRQIIPRSYLKPFLDIRAQAKKLCALYGEPYMGGYAVSQDKAVEVLCGLKSLRDLFLETREGSFSGQLKKLREAKDNGLVISDCSPNAPLPNDHWIMRRIRFEFDAFALEGVEGTSTFIDSFKNSTAIEADELARLITSPALSDSVVRRARELAKRLCAWRAFDETVEETAASLAAASAAAPATAALILKNALLKASVALAADAQEAKDRNDAKRCIQSAVTAERAAATPAVKAEVTVRDNAVQETQPSRTEESGSSSAKTSESPGVHPILRRSLFFA